jgi:aspartyl-tRNA(Asn)/glutamyl-tRNA(Gln) amidotransferase subunit C
MAVSREEVLHIASLARIGVTDDEVDRLSTQLSSILDHFAALQELDTNDVPPTSSPFPLVNVMRDDAPSDSLPHEETIANAPDTEDGFFRVRAVLE